MQQLYDILGTNRFYLKMFPPPTILDLGIQVLDTLRGNGINVGIQHV